jgi:hypothetical protein
MKSFVFATRLFAILLTTAGIAQGQCSITLDGVDGLYRGDTILSGQTVTFYLRYTNNAGVNMMGIMNGYCIYSPDGGAWKSVMIDTIGLSKSQFDLVLMTMYRDTLNHATPDTVGVGGAMMDSMGLPNGYDQRAVSITVDLSDGRAVGKHVCIDSSFIAPAGRWIWVSDSTYDDYFPSWDGPHCFYVMESPADVETHSAELPLSLMLSQNYPNPFNPTTTIRFNLPRSAHVTLSVTDILGREIVTLVDKVLGPGEQSVIWDAKDRTGTMAAGGVYFYRLQAGERFETRKMVLVK